MKRSFIIISLIALIVIFPIAKKHFEIACYSRSVISSAADAIEAAKKLIVKNGIFNFPDVGNSEDFIKSLKSEKCCDARKYFSLIYIASAWQVVLGSDKYVTILEMDECGERILYRGSTANL